MSKPVYLDYNATTPVDKEVLDKMLPFLSERFGNPSSSYEIGRSNKEAIEVARQQVAELIGAHFDEIVFTSGGTESNNHAIRGIAFANSHKGKHIVTSVVEHPAVLEVCNYLEKFGFETTKVSVDKNGKVNPLEVQEAIRPDTVLITIMHANNEVGTIQPISAISEIARKYHIAFHTDAAQSVGKIETNVNALGIDLLTIAGHKLYAPKGVGALYIRRGIQIENLIYGAGQENGFRPGTENVPYLVALGKACQIARCNFEANVGNMCSSRDRLFSGLKKEFGQRLIQNVDLSNCLPNTLSVAILGVDAHQLAAQINNEVLVSTGSACHAGSVNISPVLKAMNVDQQVATSTLRISTGRNTSHSDVDRALNAISKAVKSTVLASKLML